MQDRLDRVNGPEPGEAPRHVGGLARGRQGGAQIVLLCGLDLVAGKRVKVVGETDSCHVAEPRLVRAIARRLGTEFRNQRRVVWVRGHDLNRRDHALFT
jgi:hypothetical protein